MEITSTEYHNRIAEEYDQGYESPYWRIYNEITWDYLKDLLPESKDSALILDAGGGTGLWTVRFAELGYRVVLTDVAENILKVARRKVEENELLDLVSIQPADICDMPHLDSDSFDLTIAEGDVVSYCDDPVSAIAELARVTKRGGHVTVSVDNKLNWVATYLKQGKPDLAEELLATGRVQIGIRTEAGMDTFPAYMFTIEELEDLFADHGLEPVKRIGKPVYAPSGDVLDDPEIYREFLSLELQYCSLPSVAGRGGHIALVGRKG